MTPEEIRELRLHKKRLAKFRFKSLVRKVLANRVWLSEIEETQLGDNVRRNVAIIVRRKGIKGILTLEEKRLLNTRVEYRTDAQKRAIVMIVASLACVAHFPPKVRSRLSKAVHYQYFNQGRTIIREGHPANSMYFILDGEITVSRKTYVKIDKIWIDEPIAAFGPGDMFGEVALLQGIKRTATCTTAVDTELLCVYKSDFLAILYDTLKLQWDQVILSLGRFEYFRTWSQTQVQQCCMLAKIRQYSPLQTIYAEDKGRLNSVYFVLSGNCMILQCLKMNYDAKSKMKRYELEEIEAGGVSASRELIYKINKAAHGKRKSIAVGLESTAEYEDNDEEDEDFLAGQAEFLKKLESMPLLKMVQYKQDIEFVEVGSYSCGSVFGLGEEMEHRTIVAKNYVQCLLIPRYWLMQKSQNIGNVWQRTKMYLNSSVPSRRKIFDDYTSTNNWKKYKSSVVEQLHRRLNLKNPTTILDVPMICRIDEGL